MRCWRNTLRAAVDIKTLHELRMLSSGFYLHIIADAQICRFYSFSHSSLLACSKHIIFIVLICRKHQAIWVRWLFFHLSLVQLWVKFWTHFHTQYGRTESPDFLHSFHIFPEILVTANAERCHVLASMCVSQRFIWGHCKYVQYCFRRWAVKVMTTVGRQIVQLKGVCIVRSNRS